MTSALQRTTPTDHQPTPILPEGRRQSPRLPVTLHCALRIGSGAWKAGRVVDLSAHGFRLSWVPQCAIGRQLWVRLPGIEPMAATVRWKDNAGVGCQFARPLHPVVLDHLARRAR